MITSGSLIGDGHRRVSGWPVDLRDSAPGGPVVTYRIEDLPPEEQARIGALNVSAMERLHAWRLRKEARLRAATIERLEVVDMAKGVPLVADNAALAADCAALTREAVQAKWGISAGQLKGWCKRQRVSLPAPEGANPAVYARQSATQRKRFAEQREAHPTPPTQALKTSIGACVAYVMPEVGTQGVATTDACPPANDAADDLTRSAAYTLSVRLRGELAHAQTVVARIERDIAAVDRTLELLA